MTITFRTTDNDKWGAGKGANLTSAEVDLNFWELLSRIVDIESEMPDAAVGIDHFSVNGSAFTVHMSDGTTRGPYTLPTAKFVLLGEWEPNTTYAAQVFVTNGGNTYLVNVAHTSAETFDPGAVIGAEEIYGLLPYPVDVDVNVGFFFPGQPGAGIDLANGGTIFARIFSTPTYLPAGLSGSTATVQDAFEAPASFPIFKNDSAIGLLEFAAGETEGAFTFAGNVQFNGTTDRLRVLLFTPPEAPSEFALDEEATDLAVNFVAKKGTP